MQSHHRRIEQMVSILFENPKTDINVELMARTCDFFGADFYVSKNQKISPKKSGGVLKNKELKLLDFRKWQGRIIVTDSSFTKEPWEIDYRENDLIIFGNESYGVSEDAKLFAQEFVGFRSKGIVPCLNVGHACSAILGIVNSVINSS